MTRKICAVIASRANYGRVKPVLAAIRAHDNLELQLIAGASLLLERYGNAVNVVERDGFEINRKIHYVLEGSNPITQAKTTGLGIIELASAFEELSPDIVITVADRFETMSTSIAASYMNILLAHVQGGEITGNIDETVRHAITKLSHYHFPSTAQSAERLKKMGEEEWRILNSGCPSIDTIASQDLSLESVLDYMAAGVGDVFNPEKPYILVSQHPVTSEYENSYDQILETLKAVSKFDIQKVVLWPNSDAGSDLLSKGIRNFRESAGETGFRYFKNFPPEIYNALLKNAVCLVGNSSSFIREGSYLGTPAVIIGDRQEGREHGSNVVFAPNEKTRIEKAIQKQLEHGPYESEKIFGDGTAGIKIADYLSTVNLSINKRMTY